MEPAGDPWMVVLKSLIASGPVAVVLAICLWQLWLANRREREGHEAETKAERDRHSAEEKELRDKYILLIEKLTGALRGGSDSSHGKT